jgi:hypothetical protein
MYEFIRRRVFLQRLSEGESFVWRRPKIKKWGTTEWRQVDDRFVA